MINKTSNTDHKLQQAERLAGTKPTAEQIEAMVYRTQHIIMHKICTGCGINKDLETGYHKHPDGKYGYWSKCKVCRSTKNLEPVIKPYMVVLDEIAQALIPKPYQELNNVRL